MNCTACLGTWISAAGGWARDKQWPWSDLKRDSLIRQRLISTDCHHREQGKHYLYVYVWEINRAWYVGTESKAKSRLMLYIFVVERWTQQRLIDEGIDISFCCVSKSCSWFLTAALYGPTTNHKETGINFHICSDGMVKTMFIHS